VKAFLEVLVVQQTTYIAFEEKKRKLVRQLSEEILDKIFPFFFLQGTRKSIKKEAQKSFPGEWKKKSRPGPKKPVPEEVK
jgi:hypothetical protein